MRPRRQPRNASMGMNAPGGDYDSGTVAQMQAAIEDLARQIANLRSQLETMSRSMSASRPTRDNGQDDGIKATVPVGMPQPYTSTPEAVSTVGYVGRSLLYARGDHVHSASPPYWQAYDGE